MKRRRMEQTRTPGCLALLSAVFAFGACDDVYPIYPNEDCSGSPLLGVWQSFESTVTFRADCTADVNWNSIVGSGDYAQDGNRVSIFVDGETIVGDVTDDTLAIRDGSDDTTETTLNHTSRVVPNEPSPSGTTGPTPFDPNAQQISLPEFEQGGGELCSATLPCSGSLEGVWEHNGACPDPTSQDEEWPTECQNRLSTSSGNSSWTLTFRGDQVQSALSYREVYTLNYDRSCLEALYARGDIDTPDPYSICEALLADFEESTNEGEVPVTNESGYIIAGLNKRESYAPVCDVDAYACNCNVTHEYSETGSGVWGGTSENIWLFDSGWEFGGYCSTDQRLVFIDDPNQADARIWSEFSRTSY